MVAVKDGDKMKRAQVIQFNENMYICWLLDHGVPFATNRLYELDEGSKKLPPIAVRASLMDVVYIKRVS